MKIAVSNIGWTSEYDNEMYDYMHLLGYCGIEIAPTRIIPNNPYESIQDAKEWSEMIIKTYGFEIASIQSILYGRNENIFASDVERRFLTEYTYKAIDFSEALKCKNIVFGCPKNRNCPIGINTNVGVDFFKNISNYAYQHGVIIAMEPNPAIYNTNYINNIQECISLIRTVDSLGFRLNLDAGSMIENEEKISLLDGIPSEVNHVHISEPQLYPVKKRKFHYELKEWLNSIDYSGYVSLEMKYTGNIKDTKSAMRYVAEVFG